MADETKDTAEVAPTWSDSVRDEVSALLDIYLPFSSTGTVGLIYKHPVDYQLEDGTEVLKDTACTGIKVNLVFEFSRELLILDIYKEGKKWLKMG